jgi:hypothetical protein
MPKGKHEQEKLGGQFRPVRTAFDMKPPYRPVSCHGCGAFDVTLYAVCGLALCPTCKPKYEPMLTAERENGAHNDK